MRAIEDLSGRRGLLPVYYRWRRDVAGKSPRMMGELLEMVDARIELDAPAWPPVLPADAPLVIVANHPFGIGDGIALLALAEQLGRPYRILINSDFMRVPEIRPVALPIDFSGTPAGDRDQRHDAARGAPAPAGRHHHRRVSGRRRRDRRAAVRQGRGAAVEVVHRAARPARASRGAAGLFRGAEQRAVPSREPLQPVAAAGACSSPSSAIASARPSGPMSAKSSRSRRSRRAPTAIFSPRSSMRACIGSPPAPPGAASRNSRRGQRICGDSSRGTSAGNAQPALARLNECLLRIVARTRLTL